MSDIDEDEEKGKRVGALVIEAVENQLENNDPPETKETLDRLVAEGESHEDAIRFIASALCVEIFGAVTQKQPYNAARYVRNLKALPDEPREN